MSAFRLYEPASPWRRNFEFHGLQLAKSDAIHTAEPFSYRRIKGGWVQSRERKRESGPVKVFFDVFQYQQHQ